jgi:hypothetical protein
MSGVGLLGLGSGRGHDPWWDVTGRTARRRARRRLIDLVLATTAAALLLGSAGSRADAAGTSVNLDQWAPLEPAWQNGNLNGNNARYPEGGVVPFRLAIEGLAPGAHSIRINYDVTAGGHKAYDFLAAWNAWTAPNLCGPGGAVSSLCPTLPVPASAAIPSDPFVMDGLSVTAAQVYSGAPRRITIWGGSVTSVGTPAHSGPTDGNSTADITVAFVSSGSAVLLAWGGHLAQSAFWNLAAGGVRDGAGEVSGAPWHMRTLQLDGSGNRNQDRSIQPSAIVGELPPAALAPPDAAGPAPPLTPLSGPTNPGQPGSPPQAATPPPGAPAQPRAPAPPRAAITPPPTATVSARAAEGRDGVEAVSVAIVLALAGWALVVTRARRLVRGSG